MSNDEKRSSSNKINRRRFVSASAVTAAAGLTLVRPSAVRGSEANSRIKVACIGQGGRGSWITGLFKAHGGYEIAAVVDYFPDVSKAAGEKHGVPFERCFSGLKGYQRAIDTGVDAIVCKAAPYCFPEQSAAAIEAGCHVYMAKPVAIDVPGSLEIKRLGKLATQKNLSFLIDFQLRVDPYLQECVRRIREENAMKIEFIRAFYDDDGRADPPMTDKLSDRFRHLVWTMNLCLGGGRIVAAGIHAIDAMLWLAGEKPASCVGSSMQCRANPHGDSCDAYSLTYKFPSGITANYSGDQFRNYHGFDCGCNAYGWHSYLETRYGGKTWMRGDKWRYEGGETPDLYPRGATANIATFYKNITEGLFDNPTVEPATDANLAAILGRDAGMRGTEITWDAMIRENQSLAPDLSGLVE